MTPLLLALTLVFGAGFPPGPIAEPLATVGEARVVQLGKKFRCAVHQSVSVSDSSDPMARVVVESLRGMVADNRTDEEIEDYLVGRHGERVLLDPSRPQPNAFLWLPVLSIGIAALMIVLQVRKRPAMDGSTSTTGPSRH